MDAMAVVRGGTTTATAIGHARPAWPASASANQMRAL